ncbi:hypothetical protein [Tissierella praeacuta]|uniref:hypothetical protein n=1 Tax=Tissierella praeacuta TaxID=43131 RepID=UPI0028AE884A|nr:hypothetical protein [Tissierella praeacuta]
MKKIAAKFFPLYLALLIVILLSLNVFAESKGYNFLGFKFYNFDERNSLTANADDEKSQANLKIEKANKEVAKTIKEEVGIDVEVKEGILTYEPEKAISARNDETAKIIKKANGIGVEVTEGILYIEPEKAKSNNNYKLYEKELEDNIKPDILFSNYPYEYERSEMKNFSYSKYLFKLNTEFTSHSKAFSHADFYSQDDFYMFTISRGNSDNIPYVLANIYESDIPNHSDNEINSYYIIAYNDENTSASQDVYYFINCLPYKNNVK